MLLCPSVSIPGPCVVTPAAAVGTAEHHDLPSGRVVGYTRSEPGRRRVVVADGVVVGTAATECAVINRRVVGAGCETESVSCVSAEVAAGFSATDLLNPPKAKSTPIEQRTKPIKTRGLKKAD